MELLALGPLELRVAGELIPIRRGRPRRLLLALLLRAGEPVGTEALIEALWGEDQPQNAANSLQILVSYLRKVLGVDADGPRIETTPAGYRLSVPRVDVDLFRFEDLVQLEREEAPADRLVRLDSALALWRGSALVDAAYDDFAQGSLVRLDELRLSAVEERIEALLELGRHGDAVGELQALVLEHPLRERLHCQLMLALYRSGRQADALRAYEAARHVLQDELGLDPGPELRSMERAILEHAEELAAPPMSPPSGSLKDEVPEAPPEPAGALSPVPPIDSETLGREDALPRIRKLLEERRLVTLTGPGGAGKTRLAAEIATERAVSDRRVAWVDLSPVSDGTTLVGALAAAMGAPTTPGDNSARALLAHLESGDLLIVLDTCEHLVDELRSVVTDLLSAAGVTLLATSRQPLHVADELAWPVPPLQLPDPANLTTAEVQRSPACELFRRRAKQADPDFEIEESNAEAVGQICVFLDGLPLAIELAAARVALLSPATIVRLLDDRLRLLVDLQRVEARQQTLRATIDWSYERLDADEQAFLDRLSVFAGTFPVEAAMTVAGDGLHRDGLDLLLGLAQKSLVATGDGERFRLLDTIRSYLDARLSTIDGGRTRARHAHWYWQLAREANRSLRGADAAGWTAELRAEVPNVRAALTWCFDGGDPRLGARIATEMAWFWAVEGAFSEAERWLSRGLRVVEPDSPEEAALLERQGMHAASLGDLPAAREDCARAAAIYEALGDDAGQASSLIYLGIAHWGLGDLDEAAAVQDRMIGLFKRLRDSWGSALAMVLRARTAIDRDEPSAVDLLDAALPLARRSHDAHVIAMCLQQRARVAYAAEDLPLAEHLARESLELHERAGHAEGTVASLHTLALVIAAYGRLDEAEELHRRALSLAWDLEHPGGIAESLEGLAMVNASRGDHEAAIQLVTAADGVRSDGGVPRPPAHARLLDRTLAASDAVLDADARANARASGRFLDVAHLAKPENGPASAPKPSDQLSRLSRSLRSNPVS